MKIKKRNVFFASLGFVILNSNIASALTPQELNDYILGVYSERYSNSDRLEKYLKAKGVNLSEYKEYLQKLNTYNKSKEYLWERVENGSILIDEILFSDKEVRSEYEKALSILGSKHLAYNFIKKNMINNPEKFIKIFESKTGDRAKFRELYEAKYDRKMNDLEEGILIDGFDLKEILYVGVSDGYLKQSQLDLIRLGLGYRVLGLTEVDIEKYMEFIGEREKYDKISAEYVKSFAMYQSIYSEIMNKYGKDIYEVLTDKERKVIYEKSLKGFIFDEEIAKKNILNLLISKKVLKPEDLVEKKPGKVEQENANGNPWGELNKYLEDKLSLQKIQSLSSLYQTQGITAIFENLKDSFIWIRYGEKDVNTNIRLSQDNMIQQSFIENLFEILEKEIGLKSVFSKKEALVLLDNEIDIVSMLIDRVNGIRFDKLKEAFRKLGIDIYLKDIDYEESIEEDGSDSKNSHKVNKLVLNFEDKKIEFDLGESDKIKIENVKEILQALDVRTILSLDSAIMCKDNEIKVSKVFGLKSRSISIDELKKIFEDIDEKVNIKMLEEEV